MGRPGKDRPPLPAGIGVDDHRLVTGGEQRTLERFDAARRVLGELGPRLPATIHVMRDCSAGQPAAAATHTASDDDDDQAERRRQWCSAHERSLGDCAPGDPSCRVDPRRAISDPTGEAAMVNDRADAHRRQLLGLLNEITRATVKLADLVAVYPSVAVERAQLGQDDAVGTVWCRSCWRDNKYCEPVGVRTSGPDAGKPYYVGLCRWCGSLGFEPPPWLLEMRHHKKVIKQADIEKARGEVAAASRGSRKAQNRK